MIKHSDQRHVLVVAGEASGDLHGANLIRAAREVDPGLVFSGVAGKRMAAEGCEVLIPAEELAVMGLVEVALHMPTILRAFRTLKQALYGERRPDLVILIDYPGFNLRFARVAKRAGIPVLYYISPKVWAWRSGRAKQLAERVDHLATIFPFEDECYADYALPVSYVGNPLMDGFRVNKTRETFCAEHGLDAEKPLIGLFPGSRRSEIRYSFEKIVAAAELIRAAMPEAQFVMSMADSLDRTVIEGRLKDFAVPIIAVGEEVYNIASACDAAIAVSGTVTLQIALTGTPMVITYSAAPLSFFIGRRLVTLPQVSLANIVAGREVVPERLQADATPQSLAEDILRILNDDVYREAMISGLDEVRELMGEPGCSARVAQIASQLARGRRDTREN
ncbi:MAG: lipid-A-disaccharide synthase [Desulfuromonas sp.]|nr:MAG: lipid-A-disaccharide synthase [Desulfuromonas sp.]